MMKVYLDNAATTPVDPEALRAMTPFLKDKFGNPSSVHGWGQEAKKALDQARQEVADFFEAQPDEIIFTSCATESINLAHKGLVEAIKTGRSSQLPEIITTGIEHKAVLEAVKHLENAGLAQVSYLPVDKFGLVSLKDLKAAIRPNTVLVSVMFVNNEVGTIEPIAEIGRFLADLNKNRSQKIYFHSDATQAVQYLDCRVDQLGVDLLSFTGHKFHAPKGIGGLYLRRGTPLVTQQDGGSQEERRRAGTENTAYIIGLAKALELVAETKKLTGRISRLRDRLIKGVLKIPGTKLTGHPVKRAPHIASFTLKGVEGEAVLLLLDSRGIGASSGSACTSGSLKPSHVLLEIGIPPQTAHGSLRLSLSKNNTEKEIDYVLEVLAKVVGQLRRMAPKA
jgi:cysteine desulfurase